MQKQFKTLMGLSSVSLVLAAGTAAGQNTITVLESLSSGDAIAQDINNSGLVVGQSTQSGVGLVATVWDASGTPTNLGLLTGGVTSWAEAVNNNGEIVGYSEDSAGLRKACSWDENGVIFDVHAAIGSGGPSIPWDINDDGLIVGQASINPGFSKGFIWDQVNPAQVVGTQGYMGGANYGTNSGGELVGSGFFFGDPDDATDWVLDDRGGYVSRQITPPGYNLSMAKAVNDNGLIVGHTSFESPTAGWQACIFTGDTENPVELLGTLPGYDTSEAHDVNNSGMIVGYAWDGNFVEPPHAMVYVDGTMFDLNDLLDEDSGFQYLARATGVNDNGDIVGYGLLDHGQTGAFVIHGFTLPAPCSADMTGDGELNFFDISAFLDAYSNQDSSADFDGSGDFNFFDVSAFLKAFGAGCP